MIDLLLMSICGEKEKRFNSLCQETRNIVGEEHLKVFISSKSYKNEFYSEDDVLNYLIKSYLLYRFSLKEKDIYGKNMEINNLIDNALFNDLKNLVKNNQQVLQLFINCYLLNLSIGNSNSLRNLNYQYRNEFLRLSKLFSDYIDSQSYTIITFEKQKTLA